MITAIIIDDEENARDFLYKLLTKYFDKKITVLEKCDSVKSGVDAINKYNPDIVFLDIQMPDEIGFELFKHFETVKFGVIFTTNYKVYAIDAIRHSALDYLIKPVNYIDLLSAIKRFETQRKNLKRQERISMLLENLSSDDGSFNKVALPTQNGLDGKEFLLAKTLKYVEGLLSSELFLRVHKSYLVNINYITKFDKTDNLMLTLINGEQLPVSVRKKEQFLNAILKKE